MISDSVAIFAALLSAYYFRFDLLRYIPASEAIFVSSDIGHLSYYPSILLGGALELLFLLIGGAYKARTFLRFRRFFPVLIKSLALWALVFPGICLILELHRNISRAYFAFSLLLLLLFLVSSRFALQQLALKLGITRAFRQRILFVDWTDKTEKIAQAVMRDRWHPYELVGCGPPATNRFTKSPPPEIPVLGSQKEIETLCEKGAIDIVILAEGQRSEEELLQLRRECERTMVEFTVIPTGFHILLSGLELTTVSGVPLLGVTKLPLDSPLNAATKRIIDIAGALVGIVLGAPLVALIGLLVYWESPGPIFFTQERVGRSGRRFKMIKIRSMTCDASTEDHLHQSTPPNDHRLLKIGRIIRRLNLDEIPQFWNVLRGEMSLVGPRPERTFHVDHLRQEINSYNLRHKIVPGMTGWAQVSGFRGDTDLAERIQCDFYYMEHWTLILDFQIMLMTLRRMKGAC